MFPFEVTNSEPSAANLLQQVPWRDGLYCLRCRFESVIKHGSYRTYQRYLCKDCNRTFDEKTGTILAHAKIGQALVRVFLVSSVQYEYPPAGR